MLWKRMHHVMNPGEWRRLYCLGICRISSTFHPFFLCVLSPRCSSILVFCLASSTFLSITSESTSHPIGLFSVLILRATLILSPCMFLIPTTQPQAPRVMNEPYYTFTPLARANEA